MAVKGGTGLAEGTATRLTAHRHERAGLRHNDAYQCDHARVADGGEPNEQPGSSGAQVEIPGDVVARVHELCCALPEVTIRIDESHSPARSTSFSFEIRRRSFCLLVARRGPAGQPTPLLVLRAVPEEREALLSVGHPYFPPRGGKGRLGLVLRTETDWEEVRELVTDSYRILAPKKLQAMLD
jgi:hypothetical protein